MRYVGHCRNDGRVPNIRSPVRLIDWLITYLWNEDGWWNKVGVCRWSSPSFIKTSHGDGAPSVWPHLLGSGLDLANGRFHTQFSHVVNDELRSLQSCGKFSWTCISSCVITKMYSSCNEDSGQIRFEVFDHLLSAGSLAPDLALYWGKGFISSGGVNFFTHWYSYPAFEWVEKYQFLMWYSISRVSSSSDADFYPIQLAANGSG